MNTNEILESNKLIALFMNDIDNIDSKVSFNKSCSVNDFKYHSSWDWLMLVVKKCLIGECENKFDYSYLYESLCNIDLKETFIEVVEFIKWYNLNNK